MVTETVPAVELQWILELRRKTKQVLLCGKTVVQALLSHIPSYARDENKVWRNTGLAKQQTKDFLDSRLPVRRREVYSCRMDKLVERE